MESRSYLVTVEESKTEQTFIEYACTDFEARSPSKEPNEA